MINHVFSQTAFQFLILMMIYLYGPKYIKEQDLSRIAENKMILECFGTLPGEEYEPNKIIYGIKTYWPNYVELNKNLSGRGICGDYFNYDNLSKAYELYNKHQGAPVQLTMIFHIFVLFTLFNQLNCRIVDGTLNIFARILNNKLLKKKRRNDETDRDCEARKPGRVGSQRICASAVRQRGDDCAHEGQPDVGSLRCRQHFPCVPGRSA